MTVLYQLTGVSKRYGDREVLRVDELEIHEGEAVAIIGPSGAGKSTLLRLLGLLETPSAGTMSYVGYPTQSVVPHQLRREVTLVFQRPLLLDASVEQNIAYGLRIRGVRDDRQVEQALDLVGLRNMATARAKTLSGGERQRVSLARALVVQPRVLLLDEPTAHLDPHNVTLIERSVAALHQESGTTIVIATHNLHQARRLTTRTAMLLDGDLIETGPTERLLNRPSDPRTQAFIRGDMIY